MSAPALDGPCVISVESCMSERLITAPIAPTRFWRYRADCYFFLLEYQMIAQKTVYK